MRRELVSACVNAGGLRLLMQKQVFGSALRPSRALRSSVAPVCLWGPRVWAADAFLLHASVSRDFERVQMCDITGMCLHVFFLWGDPRVPRKGINGGSEEAPVSVTFGRHDQTK